MDFSSAAWCGPTSPQGSTTFRRRRSGGATSGGCSIPRVAGVGFQPDLDAVAKRRQLTELASGELWHSPVTAAHPATRRRATFLTGDENLIEISFAVQYGLSDPRAFFYAFDAQGDAVRLYAESIAA